MTAQHYTTIAICLAVIMAASVGGCKSEPEPPVEVSDMDKLQGTWVGTETGNDQGQWTFIVSEAKVDVNGPGPEDYSGTMTLNTEVEPRQADFLIENCAVQQVVGTTSLAIYKIEGDTFTMAGNEPGSTVRPTQFEGSGGTRLFVLTKQ